MRMLTRGYAPPIVLCLMCIGTGGLAQIVPPPESVPEGVLNLFECLDCSDDQLARAFEALPESLLNVVAAGTLESTRISILFTFARYGPPASSKRMYERRLRKQFKRMRNDEEWADWVGPRGDFTEVDFIRVSMDEFIAEYQIRAARVIGVVKPSLTDYAKEFAELERLDSDVSESRGDVRRAVAEALDRLRR